MSPICLYVYEYTANLPKGRNQLEIFENKLGFLLKNKLF